MQQNEFDDLLEENFPDFVERGAAREFMRMSEDQRWMWMLSTVQRTEMLARQGEVIAAANHEALEALAEKISGNSWKGALGNLVYTTGAVGTMLWFMLTGRAP